MIRGLIRTAAFISIMILVPGSASAVVSSPTTDSQAVYSAPFMGYYGFQPGMYGYNTGNVAQPQAGAMYHMQQSGAGRQNIVGPIGVPITSNKTLEIIEKYLKKTNNDDLYPRRLFEYNTHFEVELKEKETERGAFELIIDKFNGRVYPETGPNLTWNGKYGFNGNYFGLQPAMPIKVGDALQTVGDFIKRTSPELKIEGDVSEYYGYYEFHITLEGKLAIEANVNGFTGEMWIENWHGSLLREVSVDKR